MRSPESGAGQKAGRNGGRRKFALSCASVCSLGVTEFVIAQTANSSSNSNSSSDESLQEAIARVTAAKPIQRGKVQISLPALVDNGNSVPIEIRVDHPQSAASFVKRIILLNEKNPQREIAEFEFSPFSGKVFVSTRIRLATSQKIAAIAEFSDGSLWLQTADTIVTLAACIEGEEAI